LLRLTDPNGPTANAHSVTATVEHPAFAHVAARLDCFRHVRTPRPTPTRVTVTGGRSPGSRVIAFVHLPRNKTRSQWS